MIEVGASLAVLSGFQQHVGVIQVHVLVLDFVSDGLSVGGRGTLHVVYLAVAVAHLVADLASESLVLGWYALFQTLVLRRGRVIFAYLVAAVGSFELLLHAARREKHSGSACQDCHGHDFLYRVVHCAVLCCRWGYEKQR